MFGSFGKKKVDYEKIFSSAADTRQYIYSDRSKTVSILGDNDFIDAWLSSKNIGIVTQVIREEAIKNNLPSIKQMIWLYSLYFQNVENFASTKNEQTQLQITFLKERVLFCERAINLGLTGQSYYAMISSANLYSILAGLGSNISDTDAINALNGIIKFAKIFLASGENDQELIDDANALLKKYSALSQISNMLNEHH
ncbi:hypothetical protein [Enterobacter sp.]|uniref:hypothetical protein n=1 Tax=Enterobacter sp. TaxID=42895 RepID=UPI00296FAF6B|nr:hypothetical protein [Enterobacter sp.]